MKQLPKLLVALGPNATINDVERLRARWSQDGGESLTLYTGDYVNQIVREHVERVALRMTFYISAVALALGFVLGWLAR